MMVDFEFIWPIFIALTILILASFQFFGEYEGRWAIVITGLVLATLAIGVLAQW